MASTFKSSYDFIHHLDESYIDKYVTLKGWIRNIRVQNDLIFIEMFDGLSSKTVSQEQGLKQVAVLRAFLHYKGIADNIRNVQSSFSPCKCYITQI